MALDLSYIIPIFPRRVYEKHPEVHFKPGPFYMGDGLYVWRSFNGVLLSDDRGVDRLGWACNIACISWTLFVCVVFSLPTIRPVTAQNMYVGLLAILTCPFLMAYTI